MGSRKRSSYSQGSSGGDFVRNVGVVGVLGGLSFFLGFFVLPRMVPDKERAPATLPKPPSAAAQTVQVAQKPTSPSASEAAPPASEPVRSKKSSESGVTIEPADEIDAQKPRDFDGASKATQVDKEKSASGDSTDIVTKEPPDLIIPVAKEAGSTSKTPRKPHKTRSIPGENTSDAAIASENGGIRQGDQKPSNIDPDNSAVNHPDRSNAKPNTDEAGTSKRASTKESSDDAGSASSNAPVKRTRYRVDAGAYSRREAADKVAQRVTDLGLEASVLPITKEDGTTVYRVQQGVYRKRSNADAAQKKLSDAGLDTDIVKTGGG